MSKRVALKFEHPLAAPQFSWISRGLITGSHLCLGIYALKIIMQGLNPYILGAIALFIIEILRKNKDSKPYLKELFIRLSMQIFATAIFTLSLFMGHDVWQINIGKAFNMLMFIFVFLNFYESIETLRGRIPVRVLKK
jgi:hypothetical protein